MEVKNQMAQPFMQASWTGTNPVMIFYERPTSEGHAGMGKDSTNLYSNTCVIIDHIPVNIAVETPTHGLSRICTTMRHMMSRCMSHVRGII